MTGLWAGSGGAEQNRREERTAANGVSNRSSGTQELGRAWWAYPRFPGSPSRLLSWHGLGGLGWADGRWPMVVRVYLYPYLYPYLCLRKGCLPQHEGQCRPSSGRQADHDQPKGGGTRLTFAHTHKRRHAYTRIHTQTHTHTRTHVNTRQHTLAAECDSDAAADADAPP